MGERLGSGLIMVHGLVGVLGDFGCWGWLDLVVWVVMGVGVGCGCDCCAGLSRYVGWFGLCLIWLFFCGVFADSLWCG